MRRSDLRSFLVFLVLLVFLGLPSFAQAGNSDVAAVDEADLELTSFEVQHVDASELLSRVQALFGRSVRVTRKDLPEGEVVENLFLLSEKVFVYETSERSKRILAALKTMDVSSARDSFETQIYVPRHVSLATLVEALAPLRRTDASGFTNVAFSETAGRLVLHDHPVRLASMMKLIKDVDVPGQQVIVTCFVLRPNASSSGDSSVEALSEDLIDSVQAVVDQESYELLGVGAVSLTAGWCEPVELDMDLDKAGTCHLQLEPGSYDAESKTLTLESCSFRQQRIELQGFTTRSVLVEGRYQVIGAVGHQPILVVLRMVFRS